MDVLRLVFQICFTFNKVEQRLRLFFARFRFTGIGVFLSRFSCVLIFSVLPCFVPEYSSRGLEGGLGKRGRRDSRGLKHAPF